MDNTSSIGKAKYVLRYYSDQLESCCGVVVISNATLRKGVGVNRWGGLTPSVNLDLLSDEDYARVLGAAQEVFMKATVDEQSRLILISDARPSDYSSKRRILYDVMHNIPGWVLGKETENPKTGHRVTMAEFSISKEEYNRLY